MTARGVLAIASVGVACAAWLIAPTLMAQTQPLEPPSETALGELLITGNEEDNRPRLALLPSLSPDLEDVIVRGVVRRDFELTGLYRMIDERKAPPSAYGFEDPVDVKAWRAVGAQVVIKVAARKKNGQVEVYGLAYLLSVGEHPVYTKRIVVSQEEVRVTAHRITDALLGALTGREGGFASHMTFSAPWGKNPTVFTIDADGHNIERRTDPKHTSMAPTWGPAGYLFYIESRNYSPFRMMRLGESRPLAVPFTKSIYSLAFSKDGAKLALGVSNLSGSSIFLGKSDGTDMVKVSTTDVSTHPVFSPSGKLAWVGGGQSHGTKRIYVDGKPVSPQGFSADSPAFCDTDDGIRLVFSVAVGGGRSDIVWSNELGRGMSRLTQGSGSNTYPACSPDGRMIAFFSDRKTKPGLYVKSLKSFQMQRISSRLGSSLRWAALPPPPKAKSLSVSD